MAELRTSRSRASRVLVESDNGEPEVPLKMWEGIADLGFGPWGGEFSELMLMSRTGRHRRQSERIFNTVVNGRLEADDRTEGGKKSHFGGGMGKLPDLPGCADRLWRGTSIVSVSVLVVNELVINYLYHLL